MPGRILHLPSLPALLALSLVLPNCTTPHSDDTSDKAQKQVRTHYIAPGDNLWSIAEQHYGNGEKVWENILLANKVKADRLKVGDVLVIPEIPGVAFLPPKKPQPPASKEHLSKPNVSPSAKGWTVKPGPPRGSGSTTIVLNPEGQEVNIGETAFNGYARTNLWIVEVKELGAKFLMIHVPPAASASVPMPILYIDNNNRVTLAETIQQRFEFEPLPDDKPGFNPRISDGKTPFRDEVFKDSDGDGIPELMEDDRWTHGGTITYFRFTEQKKFVPLWKEAWKLGDNAFERVSRERVK